MSPEFFNSLNFEFVLKTNNEALTFLFCADIFALAIFHHTFLIILLHYLLLAYKKPYTDQLAWHQNKQ